MAGLQWGNVPVPNTASWTAEVGLSLGRCPYFADAGIPALIQPCAQGQGKPLFGTPHSNRQREAMARCLCDICGKSLKASTKVSLSHASPYISEERRVGKEGVNQGRSRVLQSP